MFMCMLYMTTEGKDKKINKQATGRDGGMVMGQAGEMVVAGTAWHGRGDRQPHTFY